jgi:hypothetical protein
LISPSLSPSLLELGREDQTLPFKIEKKKKNVKKRKALYETLTSHYYILFLSLSLSLSLSLCFSFASKEKRKKKNTNPQETKRSVLFISKVHLTCLIHISLKNLYMP